MSSKKIKIALSKLKGFEDPDPELEQYITPPEVAADFLNIVNLKSREGEDGKKLKNAVDLGCGTGILTIGLGMYGFRAVGIDVSPEALDVARSNLERMEDKFGDLPVKFLEKEVSEVRQQADITVLNPPFGVQESSERGSNLDFLEKSFEISEEVFALLHSPDEKDGKTRQFIKEFGLNQGFEVQRVKTYSFRLPNTMDFHDKPRKEINTDMYYFSKR